MPLAFAATFAGVLGATIGSFLNVVAYRLPRKESLVRPGSRCPGCGTAIKAHDNVPVLGWLLLRGRCRSCRTSISPRYPIVEATTAALAVAVVLTKHSAVEIVLGLVLVAMLVPVALIDLDHRIIPNKITLPAGVAAVAIGVALDLQGVPEQLIAAAAAGGFLLFFALAYPRGMGMGDVKLAFVLGLFLGRSVAVAILAGVLIGTIVGTAVMARVGVEKGRKTAVPFGPFLAVGGIIGFAALAALFVLIAGVAPWRRLRNLDVAACLTLVAPVVLLQHEYVAASVLTALPGLVYLLARCAAAGFGRAQRASLPPVSATPLLTAITPGLDPARRRTSPCCSSRSRRCRCSSARCTPSRCSWRFRSARFTPLGGGDGGSPAGWAGWPQRRA
jgi:leader peptidase (prepilin peptidase)/N-methyltransferase